MACVRESFRIGYAPTVDFVIKARALKKGGISMKKISAISRVLAFLLVVCLCSAFVPVLTFADEASAGTITITTKDGSIEVNGKNTVAKVGNYGTVTFDTESNVVTLNNVEGTRIDFSDFTQKLTVKLEGANVFDAGTTSGGDCNLAFKTSVDTEIAGPGSLTLVAYATALQVTGNLTVSSGTLNVTAAQNYGINTYGNLLISGGVVTAKAKASALATREAGQTICITGGVVDVTATGGFGMYAYSGLEVSNAVLNVSATTNAVHTYSSNGPVVIENAVVTGTQTGSNNYFFNSKDVTLKDSVFNVTYKKLAPTDVVFDSNVIFAEGNGLEDASGTLVSVATLNNIVVDDNTTELAVNGGKITYDAAAGLVTMENVIASKVDFNITKDFKIDLVGSNIVNSAETQAVLISNAVTTEIDGSGALYVIASSNTYSVYTAGNLVVSGGTVNIVGAQYALYAAGNLTVSGGSLSVSTLVDYGSNSYSVYVVGSAVVSGGEFNVFADGHYIFYVKNGNFTMTDGSLVLKGAASNTATALSAKNLTFSGGSVFARASGNFNFRASSGDITVSGDAYLFLYGAACSFDATGNISLTGGAVTGLSGGYLFRNNNSTEAGMIITVTPNVVIDFSCSSGVVNANGKVYTTDWDDVLCLEGYELTAESTYVKTLIAPQTITYEFDGEEAGIATGTVTATFENVVADDCALYWGTANGVLDGYRALAQAENLQISGNTLTYEVADRVAIPAEATHLWLTVGGTKVSSYEIPADRRPSLGAKKYTFGVLSDVHFGMDVAPDAFANAMDTMKEYGASFVVSSGDLTNKGMQAQYDAFAAAYENYSDIPFFTTSGNHDTLEWNIDTALTTKTAVQNMMNNISTYANEEFTGANGEFKVEASDAYGEYIYDYTVTYGDDLFVYLGIGPNEIEEGLEKTDSPVVKVARYVTEAQLNWLKGVLENSEDYQNVILMFHYPLKESGISLYDAAEDFCAFEGLSQRHSLQRTHP